MVVLCCISSRSQEARCPNWEVHSSMKHCIVFVLSICPFHPALCDAAQVTSPRRSTCWKFLMRFGDFVVYYIRFCRAGKNIKKMTPLEFCSFASFDLMRSSSTIFYECMFEWAATPNLILHCHDNWNIRVVKVNCMSAVFGSFKKCIPGLSCPFTVLGRLLPLEPCFTSPAPRPPIFLSEAGHHGLCKPTWQTKIGNTQPPSLSII